MGSSSKVRNKVGRIFELIIVTFVLASFSNARQCDDGKIRGVNLGGWLLLEPWITPSIFEEVNVGDNKLKIVDEYTYAQYVDKEFAKTRLDKHWDEFYQLNDLQILASVGISHIRIPYGYWMFDVAADDPFPAPSQNDKEGMRFYLKRMLTWAESVGIKVLLDLHGGQGSQNGFDNSGKRGEIHFQDGENSDRAVKVLSQMSTLLKSWVDEGVIKADTIYGLELLNEPATAWTPDLWDVIRDQFNYGGYDEVRKVFPDPNLKVVVQTGFRSYNDYDDYMQSPDYEGVVLDGHEYQCFGSFWNDLAAQPGGWETHLTSACAYGALVDVSKHPLFVGEFSLEVTDCQKYLDGGYAEPYVPPNSSEETCAYYNDNWATYPDEYKDFLKSYFLAQIDGYEKGDNGKGWFMWTGKTENNSGPEWDFIFLTENGIIPEDLCNRPTYCNY